MGFWAIAGCLAAASLLYPGYRLLKFACFLFREYYVLWNIAIGGRSDRRAMSHNIRLHAYVCKTALMDEVSINELYTFAKGMIDSDLTVREYHTVLLSYKYAIMCRDRKDGSLRGMTLLGLDQRENEGKSYTLIRLGLSLFQNYYRGGPLLYYVIAYHILKELVLHPFTPLYIAGKAFTYKSYMAAVLTMKEAYPRYDCPTPTFEKWLIDDFGRSIAGTSDVYDEEKGVLKRERAAIKNFVAPISEDDLKNPHLCFFTEQNPGWVKGHQLCMVAHVTWPQMLRFLVKSVKRARRARKGGKSQVPLTPKLSRRFSFQDEDAQKYAVTYYEVDVVGNVDKKESAGVERRSARQPDFTAQYSMDPNLDIKM